MIKEGKDVLNKYGDYQAYSFDIFVQYLRE